MRLMATDVEQDCLGQCNGLLGSNASSIAEAGRRTRSAPRNHRNREGRILEPNPRPLFLWDSWGYLPNPDRKIYE